jgi:hypothetical protein
VSVGTLSVVVVSVGVLGVTAAFVLAVKLSWQRPYEALPVAFVALTNLPRTFSVNGAPPISAFLR